MWLEWISIGISLVALGATIYTYVKHDKRLKEQQKQINTFQLEEIEKEKELEKRAIIEAKLIKKEKAKRTIKIFNSGRAIARNVKVVFPNHPELRISKIPSPIDIKPQASVEVFIVGSMRFLNKIKIDFEWQDELNPNNKAKQTLQV